MIITKPQKGRRKDGITPQEQVEITLKYLRQYVPQRYLAAEYDITKSYITSTIKLNLKIIRSDSRFSLPNKVNDIYDNSEDRICNATDSPIDRPKKNQ